MSEVAFGHVCGGFLAQPSSALLCSYVKYIYRLYIYIYCCDAACMYGNYVCKCSVCRTYMYPRSPSSGLFPSVRLTRSEPQSEPGRESWPTFGRHLGQAGLYANM